MSYTVLRDGEPTPIRLIGMCGRLFNPYVPLEWECDPCAPSHKRYRVKNAHNGQWVEYGWWELAEEDDTEVVIMAKVSHSLAVESAMAELHRARVKVADLTGEWPK